MLTPPPHRLSIHHAACSSLESSAQPRRADAEAQPSAGCDGCPDLYQRHALRQRTPSDTASRDGAFAQGFVVWRPARHLEIDRPQEERQRHSVIRAAQHLPGVGLARADCGAEGDRTAERPRNKHSQAPPCSQRRRGSGLPMFTAWERSTPADDLDRDPGQAQHGSYNRAPRMQAPRPRMVASRHPRTQPGPRREDEHGVATLILKVVRSCRRTALARPQPSQGRDHEDRCMTARGRRSVACSRPVLPKSVRCGCTPGRRFRHPPPAQRDDAGARPPSWSSSAPASAGLRSKPSANHQDRCQGS